MVTVWIGGGLGNQMFMCAYAFILKKRGYKVALDVETFFEFQQNKKLKTKKTLIRDNGLSNFNIDIPYVMPNMTILKYIIGTEKINIIEKFVKKSNIYSIYEWDNSTYADKYLYEMISVNKNSYVKGYFQSEKFFKKYKKDIYEMFQLKNDIGFPQEFLKKRNKELPLVSIHFRRTDYKYENELYILDFDYYKSAIQYLQKRIGKFDICIFSDDYKWIKSNFKIEGYNILYPADYGKYKDYEEMVLMSRCNHNIIANSTFSWWGAWLNKNVNKIVIAPKKWMKSRKYEIIPDEWVKL